jgi:hypothetical protein
MSSLTAIGACHDATFVISLPSRHSLFASRQLMPFWLGRSLALPLHFVPRPTPLVPFCFRSLSLVPPKEAKQICRPRRKTNWGEGVHESLCCEAADF